ncbi:MAG: hypothetical protein JNK65_09380, partial [Deltaproteobacteria bacterium]|nr:hypothetical protein [Deltaproteobacteria bacterium]
MTESLLARLSQTSIQNPELTQTQRSIDQAIGQFTHEMTNTQALFSMATGSLFYRFGRLATLSLAPHVGSFAPVLQASSYIVGLSSEVLAFEGTNRLLARATGNTAALQTPFWEGVRSSFVNFGALKVFGHLGAQQNAVIRNLMADAGMVAGHELTYRLGFTLQQEGTLLERMV